MPGTPRGCQSVSVEVATWGWAIALRWPARSLAGIHALCYPAGLAPAGAAALPPDHGRAFRYGVRTMRAGALGLCWALLFSLMWGLAPGCAGGQTAADGLEAAEVAYAEARRALRRSDYERARELFRALRIDHPYSRFAPLADFGIAESFERANAHAAAVEAFRHFVQMHASHELVGEARYRIARSWERQVPRDNFLMPPAYERDRRTATAARRAFEVYLDEHPTGEHHADATRRLSALRNRLAAYELYVANYYLRRDRALAAERRLQDLLRDFPQTEAVPEARYRLADALLRLDRPREAIAQLERLVQEHPDSPFAAAAQVSLADAPH